jgi:ApaG protein
MVTTITQGIKVSVEVFYQTRQSQPALSQYLFAYQVTIENCNSQVVQLLRRHWYIWEANGTRREVEGEGVIGQQPVLEPGEVYQYVSACNLNTEIGKMWGNYTLQRISDRSQFAVQIPVFDMIVPFKMN